MSTAIKVGCRKSPLALVQVKEVFDALNPKPAYELVTFDTTGDKDRLTPLTIQPADDFFTDALDAALLNKEIDLAVHSAKDLPKIIPPGLSIFALTPVMDDSDAWVGKWKWANLPEGAKVGTSSLLRQRQTKELHPKSEVVDIRGSIQDRLALIEQGKVDGIIIAACALKRLGMADKITDVLPWEGMALQGQLAVVGRSDDVILKRIFAPLDIRITYGKVVLVGAGPGDPGLVTLRGIEVLNKSDCVFYDYLVNKEMLQYAPRATHIYAGKRKHDHAFPQEELCRMLKVKAMQGLNIVRLKGGDPLIFGRGADEISYLRSYHIDVEIVPGVSSATGIPSIIGVPLTARGVSSSVAFLTAHDEKEHDRPTPVQIPKCDTIIFLMGLSKIYQIIDAFKNDGWPPATPVMIVANGTRDNEQIITGTLENIEDLVKEGKISPPALIIVGKTVDFYQYSKKKTYLHCGTHPSLFKHLGKIIPWPMISLKQIELPQEERLRFAREFDASGIIVLTSPNAVEHFMPMINSLRSHSQINEKMYAVIGKQTAQALSLHGVHAHIISQEETAEGLFKTLKMLVSFKDRTFFIPRSSLPNHLLIDSLRDGGAKVYEWHVYVNSPQKRGPLPNEHIDGIIFTSPSTVINFLDEYNEIPNHWDILAKGPVTHKALREAGYRSKIVI